MRAEGATVIHAARMIDGRSDKATGPMTLVIDGGRIIKIVAGHMPPGPGDKLIALTDHTVLPGLVGMHDHLFHIARPNLRADGSSEAPVLVPQTNGPTLVVYVVDRLTVASGVTVENVNGPALQVFADGAGATGVIILGRSTITANSTVLALTANNGAIASVVSLGDNVIELNGGPGTGAFTPGALK